MFFVAQSGETGTKNASDASASVVDTSEGRRMSYLGYASLIIIIYCDNRVSLSYSILFECLFSPSEDLEKHASYKLDFEVHDLFMFGSPISLILAFRKINNKSEPDAGMASNFFPSHKSAYISLRN